MTRHTALGFILVAFISGLLIGILAVRQTTNRSDEVSPHAPRASSPVAPSAPATGIAPKDRDDQEEMARLRHRIRILEAQAKAPPSREDEARKAEEIYSGMSAPRGQDDPKDFLRLTGQLAELRPSMTAIFARKYRESKPKLDAVALELALASGGPDAAALLREIYGSSSTQKAERVLVGISLSGEGMLTKIANAIPPDPDLASLAASTLGLADPQERMAGVGLLALQTTDQSRLTLQSLVAQDRDDVVRTAALRVLGRNGDRATLDYLLSYAAANFPELSLDSIDEEKLPPLAGTLLRTIAALDRRFGTK